MISNKIPIAGILIHLKSLKSSVFIGLLLFLSCSTSLIAQEEFETCEYEGEAAWEGDTAALSKFIASCGKIDTLNLDSMNNRVHNKAHHQQIVMRLNNGKVFRSDSTYFIADEMPAFPGGTNALVKYLHSNMQYPAKAIKESISGTVLLSFIVARDGSLERVMLERGIGGGCNEEAIRLIKQMPKWAPGKIHGKPVRVSYKLPVKFSIH